VREEGRRRRRHGGEKENVRERASVGVKKIKKI
jgi:hypothetical protein